MTFLFLTLFFLTHNMSFLEKLLHNSQEVSVLEQEIYAKNLQRNVRLTILLPPEYHNPFFIFSHYRLLLVNDGQDFSALRMSQTLSKLYEEDKIKKIIVVGIHANDQRLQEYGTACSPDYKQRGAKAPLHTKFVVEELLPHLENHFRLKKLAEHRVYAGFSLGGLSALDVTWTHPTLFSKVGVFSGSLWWRKRSYEDHYDDHNDRIMHVQVRNSTQKPNLAFWLEAGTDDETSDRNNNGVIDAIDDTLDLIKELEAKGFEYEKEIRYVQVSGGKHNQDTWGAVLPDFLIWAFGK